MKIHPKHTFNIISMPSMPAQEDTPALVKKVRQDHLRVRIHFSPTSTEPMNDKIKRMWKRNTADVVV